MDNSYKAISCHLYDKYEELAVKKTKVKIIYIDNEEKKEIEDYIVNFKTKNKEEFMILSSKVEIRLDKILDLIF